MLVSSLRFFVMPSTSLSLMRVWVVPAEDPNAVPRITRRAENRHHCRELSELLVGPILLVLTG